MRIKKVAARTIIVILITLTMSALIALAPAHSASAVSDTKLLVPNATQGGNLTGNQTLNGTAAGAENPPGDEEEAKGLLWWAFAPISVSLALIAGVFLLGFFFGALLVYQEFTINLKMNFETMSKLIVYSLPVLGIAGMAATLAMHQYNLFLLSTYLALPMIASAVIYILYLRFAKAPAAQQAQPPIDDSRGRRMAENEERSQFLSFYSDSQLKKLEGPRK